MTTYKPGKKQIDHEYMLTLHEALQAVSPALRLDECEAWRINGSRGHIYSWGDRESFLLYYVKARSTNPESSMGPRRKWTNIKRRLAFCEVTQDGDDEGCLRLVGLPNAEQAAAIRDVLGIRQRPDFSPETLQAFREQIQAIRPPPRS